MTPEQAAVDQWHLNVRAGDRVLTADFETRDNALTAIEMLCGVLSMTPYTAVEMTLTEVPT